MTAKAIPRHGRTSGRERGIPRPRAGGYRRIQAPGIARPRPPGGRLRADPLAGPVAITQRAVLGDQLKRPAAWCEMAGCLSRYDDPASAYYLEPRRREVGESRQAGIVRWPALPDYHPLAPTADASRAVAGNPSPPPPHKL